MGFLDDVVGKVTGAAGAGAGEQPALVDGILGLLSGGAPGGGLQGLIGAFQGQGLGDIVSSWVGTGENLPITGEQLTNGLGADLIRQLAAKAGLPADVTTSKLTQLLPSLVDRLTPEGKVPEGGLLQQALDLLRSSPPTG